MAEMLLQVPRTPLTPDLWVVGVYTWNAEGHPPERLDPRSQIFTCGPWAEIDKAELTHWTTDSACPGYEMTFERAAEVCKRFNPPLATLYIVDKPYDGPLRNWCTQCGQKYTFSACGPTHAILRAKYLEVFKES